METPLLSFGVSTSFLQDKDLILSVLIDLANGSALNTPLLQSLEQISVDCDPLKHKSFQIHSHFIGIGEHS